MIKNPANYLAANISCFTVITCNQRRHTVYCIGSFPDTPGWTLPPQPWGRGQVPPAPTDPLLTISLCLQKTQYIHVYFTMALASNTIYKCVFNTVAMASNTKYKMYLTLCLKTQNINVYSTWSQCLKGQNINIYLKLSQCLQTQNTYQMCI